MPRQKRQAEQRCRQRPTRMAVSGKVSILGKNWHNVVQADVRQLKALDRRQTQNVTASAPMGEGRHRTSLGGLDMRQILHSLQSHGPNP